MVYAAVKICGSTIHIQQSITKKKQGTPCSVGSNPTSPVWLTKPPGMADSAM